MGGAAVASVGLSWVGARVLDGAGGFAAHPLPFTLAPLRLLWTHAWLTGWGILEVYGANFLGVGGWAGRTFAALHLAGLALAVAGTAVALGRFLRPHGIPDPGLAHSAPIEERRRICGIQSARMRALCIPLVRQRARRIGLPDTGEAGVPSGEVVGALPQQTEPRQQTERGRPAGLRPPANLVDSVLAVAIVVNLIKLCAQH